MKLDEFKKQLASGRTDFEKVCLAGAKLQGLSLNKVRFVYSCLTYAQLDGASLSGAVFYKTSLKGATFINTNLREARLIELEQEQTRDLDLSGADLTHAILRNCDFSYAKLDTALMDDLSMDEDTLNSIKNCLNNKVTNSIYNQQTPPKVEIEPINLSLIRNQISSFCDVNIKPRMVYLIWAQGTSRFKIGIAHSIYERHQILQKQSPFPLEVLDYFWSINASADENLYHKHFDACRKYSEWFDFSWLLNKFELKPEELMFFHLWETCKDEKPEIHPYYCNSPTLNVLFEIHKQLLFQNSSTELNKLDKLHLTYVLANVYDAAVRAAGYKTIEVLIEKVIPYEFCWLKKLEQNLLSQSVNTKLLLPHVFNDPKYPYFSELINLIRTNDELIGGFLAGLRLRFITKDIDKRCNEEVPLAPLPAKEPINFKGFSKTPLINKIPRQSETQTHYRRNIDRLLAIAPESDNELWLICMNTLVETPHTASYIRKSLLENYAAELGTDTTQSQYCKLAIGCLLGAKIAVLDEDLKSDPDRRKDFSVNTGVLKSCLL